MSQILKAVNEPILSFTAGSPERTSLQAKYDEMAKQKIDIPLIIGGQEIRTGDTKNCIMPHDHQHILATFHNAGEAEVNQAIEAAMEAWKTWSVTPLQERTKIFRKAAELLQGPWRDTINAATMLNQSKNAFQAEIDAACELIDFFNFNAQYAEEITAKQPLISPEGMHNHLEYRPL
ncbi:MAG: aldehyde dehydrogenase family protein, partial [Fidelibacterota bacterium]